MGRRPCCSTLELKKGHWTSQEDKILVDYVRIHGEGKWRDLAQKTGLKRCGKSCRLRWLNYLRPGIKLGNISEDEEDLIIKLHRLLGNRWTLIAGRLPGRSGNEIKNYWNTTLSKKIVADEKNHNHNMTVTMQTQTDELEDDKKILLLSSSSDHDESVVANVSDPPPSLQHQSKGPNNTVKRSSITGCNNNNNNNNDDDESETSFREYITNISSNLPIMEGENNNNNNDDDDFMSFWNMDFFSSPPPPHDQKAHQEENRNNSHDHEVELQAIHEGEFDFSFDIFSYS
ncbi:hypothetical protein M9H77_14659 [Catharanthus roseus]|uniref:Uncharacterized protein n=1 Tax=Catharanthus roseus TaxID=4058 RepID=A0ACC0BNV3_CATRO|nr:hypothetical protein M9H77_14659 [Catharanthus roseus]